MVCLLQWLVAGLAIAWRVLNPRSKFADISNRPRSTEDSGFLGSADRSTEILTGMGAIVAGAFMIVVGDPLFLYLGVGMIGVGLLSILSAFLMVKPTGSKQETAFALEKASQVVYTIRVPHHTPWKPESAFRLVDQLLFSFPQLTFLIQANREEVRWQMMDLSMDVDPLIIEKAIRAVYPAAEVELALLEPTEEALFSEFHRYISYYDQVNMFVAPMRVVSDLKEYDPLATLTAVMSELEAGEQIVYALFFEGFSQEAYTQGEQMVTQSTIHPLQYLSTRGISDAISRKAAGVDRTEKFQWRDQIMLEEKLRQKLYKVRLLVQHDAPSLDRLMHLVGSVDTQLSQFTVMPYNGLRWVVRPVDTHAVHVTKSDQKQATDILNAYQLWQTQRQRAKAPAPTMILDPREIASLWHLPHDGMTGGRIGWGRGLVVLPEAAARLTEGIEIGYGLYQGMEREVHLCSDDRVTHLSIIGKTGVGKSTLMHRLIHQDIQQGKGVAVIDPHGTLVRDLLRLSIPENREEDVVVLDLANDAYPPPLNPLNSLSGYAGQLRVVGIIERLFEGTDQATRVASYLRAALLLLQADPQATMRDVTRVFTEDVYREQLLTRLAASEMDAEVQDFWDYLYNTSSAAMQRQIADPILNRIRPFYANPTLYPMLCHPDTLDFQTFIRERKIVLVSLALDEDRVPEQERNLVGALLIAAFHMAVMRARQTHEFYLYIDEVQKFVTTSLPVLLSEARKYGLSLVTANQFLGQLTGRTLEAVMGNVGTNILFRCSPDDASDLAPYVRPTFKVDDLTDLDRFQAVVKTQVYGQTQPAFSLLTFPPFEREIEAVGQQREQHLRMLSQTCYTPKPREAVMAWLRERYPRPQNLRQMGNESATFYE